MDGWIWSKSVSYTLQLFTDLLILKIFIYIARCEISLENIENILVVTGTPYQNIENVVNIIENIGNVWHV